MLTKLYKLRDSSLPADRLPLLQYHILFEIITHQMKSYRSTQLIRTQQPASSSQYVQGERKANSPNNPNAQYRLTQYESLARKAKEQLKEFQYKRKTSPQSNRNQPLQQQKVTQRDRNVQDGKPKAYEKTLKHTYSHKLFNKQSMNNPPKQMGKDDKGRAVNYDKNRIQKLSAEMKMDSPKKRHFIDSNQYKKLHEKLDVIENKITDMKKNLQRKKEEKQKHQEQKQKIEKDSSSKKSGLKDLVTKVPQHAELHTFTANPYSPRHNVYYVSELIRAYKDQKSLAREHLLNSLNILKILEKSKRMGQQDLKRIKLDLSKKKGYQDKRTVVFDLDETLIHCNDTLNPPYDVKLPIKFPTGQVIEAGVNIRPYAREILKNLSKYFEVILFTASHSCYANVVIDYLDPSREWVHHRLFRQNCYLSAEGMYVKDLRVINRDLQTMVLVDNAAYSYAYQLDNGIPILPYYNGQVDFQLKMLEDYLMRMVSCKDVRQINANTFKLTQYRQYYTAAEKLVEDLYVNK